MKDDPEETVEKESSTGTEPSSSTAEPNLPGKKGNPKENAPEEKAPEEKASKKKKKEKDFTSSDHEATLDMLIDIDLFECIWLQ